MLEEGGYMGGKESCKNNRCYLREVNIIEDFRVSLNMGRYHNDLHEEVILLLLKYKTQLEGLKYDANFLLSTLWNKVDGQYIETEYETLIHLISDWSHKLSQIYGFKIKCEDTLKLSLNNISQLECLSKICLDIEKYGGFNYSWYYQEISNLRQGISKGKQLKEKELNLRNKISVNYDIDVLYHYDFSNVNKLLSDLHAEFSPTFLEEMLDYTTVKKREDNIQELEMFFTVLEQILNVLLLNEYGDFSLTEISIESIYQLLILLQKRQLVPRSWLDYSQYNYYKILDLIEENRVVKDNINKKLSQSNKYFETDESNSDSFFMIDEDRFTYYYENRDALCSDMKSLVYHIDQLNKINDELVSHIEADSPFLVIHEILGIIDILYLSQDVLYFEDWWINEEEFNRVKGQFSSLLNKVAEVKLIKEKISVEFDEEIFESFDLNFIQKFSKEFVSIFRFFKKQYRENMKQLRLLYKGKSKPSSSQVQNLMLNLTEYYEKLEQLNVDFDKYNQLFGPINEGIETDFDRAEKNFELIDQIIHIGNSKGLSLKQIKCLINSKVSKSTLDEYRELYHSAVNHIDSIINQYEMILNPLKNYKFETLQILNDNIIATNLEMFKTITTINEFLTSMDDEVLDVNLLKQLISIRNEVEVDLNNLRDSDFYLKKIFEEDYQGLDTEWEIIKQRLNWFEQVRECIRNISIYTQRSFEDLFESVFPSNNVCIFSDKKELLESFVNIKPIYDLFVEKRSYKLQMTLNEVNEKLIFHKNLLYHWRQLASYLSLYRHSRADSFISLEQELKLLVNYWELRVELGEVGTLLRSQFGTEYKGVLTDWSEISSKLDCYVKFQSLLSENSINLSQDSWYQFTKPKSITTISSIMNEMDGLNLDYISYSYAKYFKDHEVNIKLGALDELLKYFNRLNQESTHAFKLKQYLILKFTFEQRGFGELFKNLILKAHQETENNRVDLVSNLLKKNELCLIKVNEVTEKKGGDSDTIELLNKSHEGFQNEIENSLKKDEESRYAVLNHEEGLENEIISEQRENHVTKDNCSSSEQNNQVEVQKPEKDKIGLRPIVSSLENIENSKLSNSNVEDTKNPKIKQLQNELSKEKEIKSIAEPLKTRRISDQNLNKIYLKLKPQYRLKIDNRILEAKDLKYNENKISFTEIYHDIKSKLELLQEQLGTIVPLGLIYLNEEQYKYLKFYTKDVILTYHNTIDYPTALLITVCLVQIIAREFDGGDFWGSICKSLGLKDSTQLRRLMQEAIQAFCISEDLYFHFTMLDKKIRRNYRSTIMIHAIVSNKTSQSLFDFIYDFYLEDLNEMYQNHVVHEKLSELIDLIDEDLDWSKGETNANEVDTSSIYQLSIFTKMAIVYYKSVLIEVMENIIYNMHSFQFKTKDYKSDPIRFYELYRQWRSKFVVRSLIETRSHSKLNGNSVVRKKYYRRFSKASYALRDRELILCVPEQTIEKKYLQSNLYIEFYEKNELLPEYTRELDTYGKVNFKTDEIEVTMSNFYKHLSYKIVADNIIIYDSKNILYRDYLTFDEHLKEKVYSNQPNYPFYLVTGNKDLVTIDGFYNEYSEKQYKIYSLNLEKEDQVVLNNQILFNKILPEGIKKCVLDDTYLCQNITIETPSNNYQVYTQHPILKFSLYNDKIRNYHIEVNGCLYEMDSLSQLLLNHENERLKKYELKLSENIFKLGKLYSVIIRKKNDNQIIFSTKFIVIKDLSYQLDKVVYYQDKNVEVLDFKVKDITLLDQSFPVTKHIHDGNQIEFDCMTVENLSVKLVMIVPKVSWTLNETFNSEERSQYLLENHLHGIKELELSVPFNDYHLIAIGKDGFKFIDSVREGCYKMDQFKYIEEDFITIGLLITEMSIQIPLFEIWYHPTLKNMTFEYIAGEEPKIQFDYTRIGEFTGIVKLYDSNKILLNEVEINSNIENSLIINAKVFQERCLIQVIQFIEDDFGFSSEEIIILETTVFTGDDLLSEIKDNVLEVKLCDVDGVEKVVNNFYLTDFKVIREGFDYEAHGFYKKERGGVIVTQRLDDKINPISIHILGRHNDKLQFTLTDNAGDGFVYHKQSQKLAYLNTKDRESYDYPDFYLLDLQK